MKYKPVIGLEIHAELNTKTKMFCDSLNDPNETRPNTNVCPICLAYPGTLPVINSEAVNKVIKVGLALGAKINEHSWFERKNYFYPDLPKGYQISQFEKPFCEGGVLKLSNGKEVKITRVHLEEDTGRLVHGGHSTSSGRSASLIDFNRAGVPLMELVTEPDLETGEEAAEFGSELQLLLRYLGVSEADMEKGQLRIETNISLSAIAKNAEQTRTDAKNFSAGSALSQRKSAVLGTKVEIKNLNSFKACERAIDYEIARQEQVLESGERVIQETRGWNENKGETFSQRTKEESHDYRYFPEPDLPPVRLSAAQIEDLRAQLPELPAERRERFVSQYVITQKDSEIFTLNRELGDYFEKVASELEKWLIDEVRADKDKIEYKKIIKLAANYLITEVKKLMSGSNILPSDFKMTVEKFAKLITFVYEDMISSSVAQEMLKIMFKTGMDPKQIIVNKIQINDRERISHFAGLVIKENVSAVNDYKDGKTESLKFLVGQMMKISHGRANPQISEEILKDLLK